MFNSRNENKNKYEYNKKHANDYNSLKSRTLYDYYKTTSIKRSSVNKDNKENNKQNIKTKNIIINNRIDFIKINNINYESLLKRIEEQNLILEKKGSEISTLKLSQKENEKIISHLKQEQKDSETEIKRCRLDISNMLKEISNIKRDNKKRWLNEQQYYIGKISTIYTHHYTKNRVIEYWEDGKDVLDIKKKLEIIKKQKKEIDNSKNELMAFKLIMLEREEKELNEKIK